jgi:hypothetical protein
LAYPFTGALLLGLANGTGWALLVTTFLDAMDLHGKTRVPISIMLLLAALVYGAVEIQRVLPYRKAPYPTSRLARLHVGIGVGGVLPIVGSDRQFIG